MTEQSDAFRDTSLRACESAYRELENWTFKHVITEANIGYQKELAENLHRVIEQHLEKYPDDKKLQQFKNYTFYLERAFDFKLNKW